MTSVRALALAAVGVLLTGPFASAQDLTRYRVYDLDSSLASVIAASGARATDAKTLHERPATIQELEWFAPYGTPEGELADPVREIAFSFYNDALYQVVVTYDRTLTKGLTDDDMIDILSATYGLPVLASARLHTSAPATRPAEAIVIARWEDAESSVVLHRSAYSPKLQLILTSKPLSSRARDAVQEALRLDKIDAPRVELERRQKEAADADAARDKARTTNKPAFRP